MIKAMNKALWTDITIEEIETGSIHCADYGLDPDTLCIIDCNLCFYCKNRCDDKCKNKS